MANKEPPRVQRRDLAPIIVPWPRCMSSHPWCAATRAGITLFYSNPQEGMIFLSLLFNQYWDHAWLRWWCVTHIYVRWAQYTRWGLAFGILSLTKIYIHLPYCIWHTNYPVTRTLQTRINTFFKRNEPESSFLLFYINCLMPMPFKEYTERFQHPAIYLPRGESHRGSRIVITRWCFGCTSLLTKDQRSKPAIFVWIPEPFQSVQQLGYLYIWVCIMIWLWNFLI